MSTDLAPRPTHNINSADQVANTLGALTAIRTFIGNEFKAGIDYGIIPGTNKKNVLLKAGAEKALMYFNSYARLEVERVEMPNGNLEVIVNAIVIHRGTEKSIGNGVGSCSTMESKHRFRKTARVCPACGTESIIKGRDEYGGGWLCYAKKGGCGAKYPDGSPDIEGQTIEEIENTNPHDQRNTVLKMAKKRAIVDAALSLGCLSELFTQDLEELFDHTAHGAAPEPAPEPERTPRRESRSAPAPAPAALTTTNDFIRWAETTVAEANNWWKESGNKGLICQNHWQLIRHLGKAADAGGLITLTEKARPGEIVLQLLTLEARRVKATAKHYLYEDLPARTAVPDEREPGQEG